MNSFGNVFDHDHIQFTDILKKHTTQKDGQTWIDYRGLKYSTRAQLQNYLKALSTIEENHFKTFTRDQKLAFLINAYNGFTIEWILLHYPVKSIKDTGTFLMNPWKKVIPGYKLLGKSFTLDNIEHDRIRVEFKEPRIHFALNCASIGCPSLRPSAFTGKGLEKELSESEESFFKNPRKFKVTDQKVHINSIFKWYGTDFEKKFGSLYSYISNRSEFYGIARGLSRKSLDIYFMDYDWSLNGI